MAKLDADGLYSMSLFETKTVEPGAVITRVPGGWVYESFDTDTGNIACCFIPFHNEFQVFHKSKSKEAP